MVASLWQAGETVTVWLYPAALEFAPVGPSGARTALAGEYTVSVGVEAAAASGMGFARHRFVAE